MQTNKNKLIDDIDPLIIKKVGEPQWKKTLPLKKQLTQEAPYPIECLPPILQKAITGYKEYGQQPISLIASSALANVSLACQGLANVGRDSQLTSPVSMYFLLVASSGERKSAIDNAFSYAARTWESKIRGKTDYLVRQAITNHKAWKMEHDGLLNQIKRAHYNDDDIDYLKSLLKELDHNEPEIPLQPTLYFEDCTIEALALHLAHGWPSAAFWSDEAGIVLGSHSMKNNPTRFVALLNRLWDGKSSTTHRKTTQSYTIQNRRLTLNLMMQPVLMNQLHQGGSSINRQSGFMARSLMSYPTSNMGNRLYKEPPTDTSYLKDFNRRITECLNQSKSLTQDGCINLPIIFMSSSAKTKWVEFFNMIEAGLTKTSEWSSITDFASKSAENVARLAALFHLFEGCDGDICVEHIEQAIEILLWHLNETKRILGYSEDIQSTSDAEKLLDWFTSKNKSKITQRDTQRLGPLRNKHKLEDAIYLLEEHNYLKTTADGKKVTIDLNPNIN